MLSSSIRFLLVCFFTGYGLVLLSAQQRDGFDFRFKIGLIVEYGTHVHRIGMLASTSTSLNKTQLNAELRGYYNFRTFGPPTKGIESVWSLGLAQGFGKDFYASNPLIDAHFFNTGSAYSLGYTFYKYQDKIETTQGTAAFFFSARDFFLNFENDLFGYYDGRDRFRTGGFSLNYYKDGWLLSLKNIIWTGETRCKEKISYTDTDYPSRYGYHDVTKCKYGNFAHGIAAAAVTYIPDDWFGQYFTISAGIDDERIRHFFQNKLIHDMYFVPDGINPSQNLHYPMLDENGQAYLFLKDQVLKKGRFYGQVGANGHWLY